MTPSDEQRLITRAQAGDMIAFRALYDAHLRRVTAQVGRTLGPGNDVEGVVQEVFVQVFRGLKSFRGDSKFTTWLYRLTQNTIYGHLRRHKPTVDLSALRNNASLSGPDPNRRLNAREKLERLYAAINDLDEDKRRAFILFEIEGNSLAEIAEITGVPLNTAAARVRRARERLRYILEQADTSSSPRTTTVGGTR